MATSAQDEATERPLCIDLFCGLGGWTDGFLAAGWCVVGYDITRQAYGDQRYPAHLIIQDVTTIDGGRLRDADMIVASSPCQEFSYRAMPWSRARALPPPEMGIHLFCQARRIQEEASAAAGRRIPLVQENVRGAERWVGRAQWSYGSYYLWGDVPALMPIPDRDVVKAGALNWRGYGTPGYIAKAFNGEIQRRLRHEYAGIKGFTPQGEPLGRNYFRRPSGPPKAEAAAVCAKIPFRLAHHIATVMYPRSGPAVR